MSECHFLFQQNRSSTSRKSAIWWLHVKVVCIRAEYRLIIFNLFFGSGVNGYYVEQKLFYTTVHTNHNLLVFLGNMKIYLCLISCVIIQLISETLAYCIKWCILCVSYIVKPMAGCQGISSRDINLVFVECPGLDISRVTILPREAQIGFVNSRVVYKIFNRNKYTANSFELFPYLLSDIPARTFGETSRTSWKWLWDFQ